MLETAALRSSSIRLISFFVNYYSNVSTFVKSFKDCGSI